MKINKLNDNELKRLASEYFNNIYNKEEYDIVDLAAYQLSVGELENRGYKLETNCSFNK